MSSLKQTIKSCFTTTTTTTTIINDRFYSKNKQYTTNNKRKNKYYHLFIPKNCIITSSHIRRSMKYISTYIR